MRKSLLVVIVLLLPALVQAQTKLLRSPTFSKGKVAFSYQGDIWIANEDGSGVGRLTVKGRNTNPRFSPDGQSIAFSSNRNGNNDIYIMPITGGKVKQITFHTADDTMINWSADGKKIVFLSSRNEGVFPGISTLFEIAVDGGTEQPIPTDWGSWASYSADGSKVAFTRHPGVWSRKHYRGSYNVDLWVMNVADKTFTRLADVDYKGNYMWPMYAPNGDIYYVADQLPDEKNIQFGGSQVMHSVNNIWKISERGGRPVQVTRHTDGNLFFPSMSADGKTIVYEENFGLWKLDLTTGQTKEIPVNIVSEVRETEAELRTFTNAESFSLSPTNRRAAIVTHGEVFTIATDRGEAQRVTDTPGREEAPRWSPDGKWIAFVSDRSGCEEIWIADELGKNPKKLTNADCDKNSVMWAPDSKSILWTGSDFKLCRTDIETGKTDELASSTVAAIGSPQLAPDGKWISYSKEDSLLRSHVYVKNLENGEEHMIASDEFAVSSGAKWTPDGKRILFIGGLGAPGMASISRGGSTSLYAFDFVKIDKAPEDRDINTEAQAAASSDTPATAPARGGRGGGIAATRNAATGGAEVKIDWNDIEKCIKQFVRVSGNVSTVLPSPDGRTYALVVSGGGGGGGAAAAAGAESGPGLYTVAEDGTRLTRINTTVAAETTPTTPRGRGAGGFGGGFGDLQWARDGRSLYYLSGGSINSVSITPAPPTESSPAPAAARGGGGGRGRGQRGGAPAPTAAPAAAPAGGGPRRITFSVRMEIDISAERSAVFQEAWRVMKNRFYDANMHGVNWAAARDVYGSLLPYIADNEELHNVIMVMIGELNASHTGISGGGYAAPGGATVERIQLRYPGFDLAPDSSGYYKVTAIDKTGPADHEYIKLAVGNYILAVNGKQLKTNENLWKVLGDITTRKFEFTVNSTPQTDGAWTVGIEPMSAGARSTWEYDHWVESRTEMVDKLSDGQIGYLHIRAMDAASLAKFEQELLKNLDKKALIIDQRFNGGGGIDQELLNILVQRTKYQFWRPRGSSEMISRPVQAFFGPMVVMQNERSASNAEMFPDGFRTLGLGKVVGVPTYGAVIGTGSFSLLDGSSIRTPSFGVYTNKGQNFENWGVPPDVMIDNTPADFIAGRDRQVEKAVETLKNDMK